jgi:glycosyltransferase involved in cell wall biosynthesis
LRILHVINSLGAGGAERLVLSLAAEQMRAGHEPRVLSLSRAHEELVALAGVRVDTCETPSPYGWRPYACLRAALRACRPDVVHAHLFPAQLYAAMLRPGFSGTRFVTTEHNTYNRRRGHGLLRPLDRLMYARYDAIACITEATREALLAWCAIDKPQSVIANGIDLEAFASGPRVFRAGPWRVLTVARLEEQKGLETLVDALAELPEFELSIVGTGSRRRVLEARVRALGLEARVKLLGFRDDVPVLLRTADLYAQPSRWEGFGIAAVEAMASGLPVVCSDVPGLRDVVGSAGLTFRMGDPASLAGALRESVRNAQLYEGLSRKAVARAAEFSLARTHDGYMAIYRP